MRVEVFDPPLCCPTGACGPSVDPLLLKFNADLAWLAGQGIAIERFNLAQQPQAFLMNSQVAAHLGLTGVAALPLVLCEGQVIASGHYPSREALTAAALPAILPAAGAAEPPRSGLRVIRPKCEPGSGCC